MAGTVVIELVPCRAFSRPQSPLIHYLRGCTVSSTPLFSSLCKIIRTNDVISLDTSTIIIFDKLCNSCYYSAWISNSMPGCSVSPTLSVFSAPFHLPPLLPSSPIFRIFFQVSYPVTPLFAALTKTAGVCTNNSHNGTSPLTTERNSHELAIRNNHHQFQFCPAPLPAAHSQRAPLSHGHL